MRLSINSTAQEYAEFATQCNNQGLRIEQQGDEWLGVAPPKPSLEELKTKKTAHFKAQRDIEEVKPILYGTHTYDFDDKARERMRIAEKALVDNNLQKQAWTTADNQIVELTVADFKAINTAAAIRSGQLHTKYNQLKVQVNTCVNSEELDLIKWE